MKHLKRKRGLEGGRKGGEEEVTGAEGGGARGSLLDQALKEEPETGGGERVCGAGGRNMNVVSVNTCSRASRRGDSGQRCGF